MRKNNTAVLMKVDESLINELFIYFVDIPFIPLEKVANTISRSDF